MPILGFGTEEVDVDVDVESEVEVELLIINNVNKFF